MVVRVVATLVLIVSLAYLGLGVYGLINASRMASTLAIMSSAMQPAFDPAHWALRWRLSSAGFAVLGLLGAVSGVIMFWRRAWPLALWAGAVTALFVVKAFVFVSHSAVYAFEVVEPAELLIVFLVAAGSWVLFHRVSASARVPRNAS